MKCWKCGQSKPETAFNRDRSRKYGRDLTCRDCTREKCRAYAAAKRAAKPRANRCGIWGTLEELGEQMVESFLRLPLEEQEKLRKEIYEKVTGKAYSPSTEGR
jgi:hypothetical protein